jgi:hypothetical protein
MVHDEACFVMHHSRVLRGYGRSRQTLGESGNDPITGEPSHDDPIPGEMSCDTF